MSYILDALKKAEAERNPDSSLNAHAPPSAQFPTFGPQPAHAPRVAPWLWAGMTAAAIAIAALAWLKPWQSTPAPVAVAAASPAPSAPVIAAAPAPTQQMPAPAPAPAATAPAEAAAPPAPHTSKQEAKQDSKQESRAATARPENRKAVAAKQPAEKKPVKETAKARAPEPTPAREPKPTPAPAPSTENRVMALQELPAHIQNEIPRVAVNGYIYSPNKADRTVLINTRLLREGEQVAPDLMLEQLTPSGMVLNYKGYRYRTSY
jgi:general secretion pathway protein B